MKLQDKVLKTIQKYNLIQSGDSIVIGVSGGPDSMTLLNVLINLKQKLGISKIVVATVNHMIREEAEEETKFVENFCESHGIEFYLKKVDVQEEAKSKKTSTELAGRNARYDFFEEVLKKTGSNKIATAHNLNDNAETVLMNLLRGSGVSGLKGIEKIRDGKFIRPIIECKRSEVEQYCVDNKLNPRYDKTNNENTYTRNKIRNMLIPYIEENFNPNIVDSLNRLSTIATKEDEYIHIEDIIKLCGNNIGNKYLMPNKNIKIFIKKGKIFFTAVI